MSRPANHGRFQGQRLSSIWLDEEGKVSERDAIDFMPLIISHENMGLLKSKHFPSFPQLDCFPPDA